MSPIWVLMSPKMKCMTVKKKWLDTPTKHITHILGTFIADKYRPTCASYYLLYIQLSSLASPLNSTH